MLKFLITTIFIVIGSVVGLALLRREHVPPENQIVQNESEKVYDGCPVGFDRYQDSTLDICYPVELTPPATSDDPWVFQSADQTLTITREPITAVVHLCNIDEPVVLARYSAMRTRFLAESVAGCGKPYRFVTNIESDEGVVSIDLHRSAGVFETSEDIKIIEQSLVGEF